MRKTGKVITQESHLEAMDMYHKTTFTPISDELFFQPWIWILPKVKKQNMHYEKVRKNIEI